MMEESINQHEEVTQRDYKDELSEYLDTAKDKINRVNEEIKEMTTKLLTDLDKNLVKFTEHIKEELTNQKENLFNLISTLSKSFTEQENINSDFISHDDFKEKSTAITQMMEQIGGIKIQIHKFKQTYNDIVSSLKHFEIEEVNSQNKELESMEQELCNIMDERIKKNIELRAEYIVLKSECQECEGTIEVNKKTIRSLSSMIVQLQDRYNELVKKIEICDNMIMTRNETIQELETLIIKKRELSSKLSDKAVDVVTMQTKFKEVEIQEKLKSMESNFVSFYNDKQNFLCIYHIELKRVIKFTDKDNSFRVNYDSVQMKNKMYVAGGFDSLKIDFIKTTIQIEITPDFTLQKQSKADMIYAKSQHKLVAFTPELIYSLGGKNRQDKFMKTCEIYNVKKDTWTEGPHMSQGKSFIAATAFQCSSIYTFGGLSKVALNTIESLHPNAENTWKIIKLASSTWTAREEAAAVQISQREILVFGGINTQTGSTDECFVFDVDKIELTKSKDSLKKKEWFASRNATRCNKNIYIFGFHSNDLHIYENGTWSIEEYEQIVNKQ